MNNNRITNVKIDNDNCVADLGTVKQYYDLMIKRIEILPYTKNYTYRKIFYQFIDLTDANQFELNTHASGVVIESVGTELIMKSLKFIGDYDPKTGMNIKGSHINLSNIIHQSSDFTILISFLHNSKLSEYGDIGFGNN